MTLAQCHNITAHRKKHTTSFQRSVSAGLRIGIRPPPSRYPLSTVGSSQYYCDQGNERPTRVALLMNYALIIGARGGCAHVESIVYTSMYYGGMLALIEHICTSLLNSGGSKQTTTGDNTVRNNATECNRSRSALHVARKNCSKMRSQFGTRRVRAQLKYVNKHAPDTHTHKHK